MCERKKASYSRPCLVLTLFPGNKDNVPFAKINADPQVIEFYPACTQEESQLFIHRTEEKFERNGFGFWVIESKASGSFIGFVGLNIPNFEAVFMPCVEIGWRLGREHWGNGYATEGAKAALAYVFAKRD